MKTARRQNLITAALVGALALHATAFAQSTRWDKLNKLPFKEDYRPII